MLKYISSKQKSFFIKNFFQNCEKFNLREVFINKFFLNKCLNEDELKVEYFLIYNKYNELKGILNPELTYISHIENIAQNNYKKYCYYNSCYRNESSQKNRLNKFYQVGVEYINNSKNYMCNAILCFIQIKMLLSDFKIKNYVLKIVLDEKYKEYEKLIIELFQNIATVEFNTIQRHGAGNNAYYNLSFEVYYDNIEILGGGMYNLSLEKQKIDGVGFAIGVERFVNILIKNNYYDIEEPNIQKYKILLKNKENNQELFNKFLNLYTIIQNNNCTDITFSTKFITSQDTTIL
ncbi:Histidine--tRNA ligase [bacterium AB1]|nr:Histidine--tRNA ligase [bacterium AB1]